MQQDMQNYESEKSYEELDMTTYGDIAVTKGGKPRFDNATTAAVIDAKVKSHVEKKEGYYPLFLQTTFEVDGRRYTENYGGGRLYVSESQNDNIWVGPNSLLGRVVDEISKHTEQGLTLSELQKKMVGRKVLIKTEDFTVEGREYPKIMIQEVLQ